MSFIEVNGVRLHVQELGRPDAPPVVLVHGLLTGNVASWYFGLGPALAATNFVRMYDQRGHGRSDRPTRGYRIADLAADLDGLTADLRPAVLVGHSVGGVVALRRAVDHPDRVAGVVTIDSFVAGGAGPATGGEPGSDRSLDGMVREAGSGRDPWSAGAGATRTRRATAGWEGLLSATSLVADLSEPSPLPPDRLAALTVPVLSVIGARSPFRSDVERLAASLPAGLSSVVLLDGGHALHLDAPHELQAVVVEFVAGCEAAGGTAGTGTGGS